MMPFVTRVLGLSLVVDGFQFPHFTSSVPFAACSSFNGLTSGNRFSAEKYRNEKELYLMLR